MSEHNAMNGNGSGNGDGKHAMNGSGKQTMKDYCTATLETSWEGNLRWCGIECSYSAEDVIRLRRSVQIEYTLAHMGTERLWNLLNAEPYVATLGALTGNQTVQQVKTRLKAIYLNN